MESWEELREMVIAEVFGVQRYELPMWMDDLADKITDFVYKEKQKKD